MRTTTSAGNKENAGKFEYGWSGGPRHTWAQLVAAVALVLAAGAGGTAGADDGSSPAPEATVLDGPVTPNIYAMTAPSTSAPDRTFRSSIGLAVGREPNLRGGLTPPLINTVRLAFPVAMQRVLSNPTCTRLFEDLDADPAAVLARTLYYPASGSTAPACKAGADAFTIVGSPVTYLCPSFAGLSRERAAFIIIHEALHFAGLRERPMDPKALTSFQINEMVKRSCRLQSDRVTEDAGFVARDHRRSRGGDRP